MAKENKEKRESKTDKKALLKVKSKNKFKKKLVVNESNGVENEQSPVIIEGKGEKNMMTKLMKKKLKEKMNKKVKSSVKVKREEKTIPSEKEEKIISGKEKRKVKNEKKIIPLENEKISNGKEKKKGKNKSIKKKDIKLKKREKKSKESTEEISELDENSSKGMKRKSTEEIEVTAEEISLVDEDSSKGMKKWLKEYKDSRLDIELLQTKIDRYIIAHEEQLEQEKKEREAGLAEEGWTVVAHSKGRKKSTDESGTGFGAVSAAAAAERMANKKLKEEGGHRGFYAFQKRDAHRTEIMKLQSEFEKDKKLVQQMKAARKFRP